jgi:hypothetical protein
LNFLGCSLGPFPFASAIKCHQKSICNSAGSPLGWALSIPRATPQLGSAAVSCVVPVPLPFFLFTRPARACPSVRAQSPPPTPPPLLSPLAGYRTLLPFNFISRSSRVTEVLHRCSLRRLTGASSNGVTEGDRIGVLRALPQVSSLGCARIQTHSSPCLPDMKLTRDVPSIEGNTA